MPEYRSPWADGKPRTNSDAIAHEVAIFDASLRSFLDIDPRPTFVIDNNRAHAAVSLAIPYVNPAMRRHNLHERISFDDAFWKWATVDSARAVDEKLTQLHRGLHWIRTPLNDQYTIIAACELGRPDTEPIKDKSLITTLTYEQTQGGLTAPDFRSSLPKSAFVDWFLSFDFASTILGPIEVWSVYFQASVRMMLYDPRPVCLIVTNGVLIWNEAYVFMLGSKHPAAYAKDFRSVFPEPDFQDLPDVVDSVVKSGESMHNENVDFTMMRYGFNEETFFSFTLIPIFDANGEVFCVWNPAFETTDIMVASRRMSLLTRLILATAASRDVEQFWVSALDVLKSDQKDISFSSVYAPVVDDTASSSNNSDSSGTSRSINKLKLIGSCNLPAGHPTAAEEICLDSMTGLAPHLRRATTDNRIVVMHSKDGPHVEDLLVGVECYPGEPCCTLIILPVKSNESEEVAGFVVCGVNRRRPWDDNFASFLQVLSKMLSASMAASVLVEDEARRARVAAEEAAREQQKLADELALEMKRSKAMNMRFIDFANKAPMSIYILDPQGRIVYGNDLWSRYSGFTMEDDRPMGWLEMLDMTQVKDVEGMMHQLTVEHKIVTYETRLAKGTVNSEDPPWILTQAFPEINDETGELEAIIGCFTDITAQKQAELLQQKRTEDALAAKKLQEAFVDITSHELRNPMAVVLMCCEQIIDSLGIDGNVDAPRQLSSLDSDALASSLAASKTIMHCVTHQRRIVDDILTLSKLDSDLLPVAPVRSNVMDCVNSVISMFTGELKAAGIEFKLIITDAFKLLDINYVYVDPSRLAQIFINLMTNAIKFTQAEPVKRITVELAASLTRPTESTAGVQYIAPKKTPEDEDSAINQHEGNGAPIFLMFTVMDTGRGLTPSEKDILFRRFSQASPRTHVQYGGSGLGLYISRELAEKQGGQIGVSSVSGQGSWFSFYVKARRAEDIGASASTSATTKTWPSASPLADELSLASLQLTASAEAAAARGLDNKDIPVLIVEDNLLNRKVLKKALTRLGFPVLEAGHGEEALEMIKQSRYWAGNEKTGLDIAVMTLDNEMPVMDGMSCIRKIRELEAAGQLTSHIPTIGCTANARKEQVDTFMHAGVDDVVSKPFKTADLVQQIKLWASRRNMNVP